ncbi:MAG: YbaB/EbfC family nucleoid-associated protein [Planctomycetota bacterium]|jgi:DNA-binding YbaB/EbfC family protein
MLEGLSNLPNIAKLLKNAGQLKGKVEELQRELGEKTVTGSAGGGMVTVTANGRQEILSVQIEDEVLADGDKGMIQDLVAAACNAALERSREMARQELARLTGGLGIDFPGIM